MRFGSTLFATLLLAGALANSVQAQSIVVTGSASSYTGPYSVYGPGLTYRQDPSSYKGPYSERFSSSSSSTTTASRSSIFDSPSKMELKNQTGNAQGLGDARPDAGRLPANLPARPRYVRLSITGTTIQGIVIP